jgi:hypothetical protein
VLTGRSGGPITRSNDGGTRCWRRNPSLREAGDDLRKEVAGVLGKVLKVDSFGETEGTFQIVWGLLWASDVGSMSGSLTIE